MSKLARLPGFPSRDDESHTRCRRERAIVLKCRRHSGANRRLDFVAAQDDRFFGLWCGHGAAGHVGFRSVTSRAAEAGLPPWRGARRVADPMLTPNEPLQ